MSSAKIIVPEGQTVKFDENGVPTEGKFIIEVDLGGGNLGISASGKSIKHADFGGGVKHEALGPKTTVQLKVFTPLPKAMRTT